MKAFFLCLSFFLAAPGLAAPYDDTFYRAEFWSGEYPNGFSVVGTGVMIPVRTDADLELPSQETCGLPQKAVIHPWNGARPADFVTYSKIVPMKVKNAFTFEDGDRKVDLKKGDLIEYLVYGGEGYFLVRINGVEYGADQSLFENVEEPSQESFRQDEWVRLNCENGGQGWALLSDLLKVNEEGETIYYKGLDNWFLGFVDYGEVRDLTDEQLPRP